MHIRKLENILNPFISDSGEVIKELVGNAPDSGLITSHSLAHISIQAGKSSQAHYHKTMDETYYILSGNAHMNIDNQEFELGPGHSVLIQPLEIHQIFNLGPENLEFLAVCSPAWSINDSYTPK